MAIKKDPQLYLRHLQQANQLRKQQLAFEEDKHAQHRSRETGFELHFTGANAERLRSTSKQPFHTRKSGESVESPVRKRWNLPPVCASPGEIGNLHSRGSLSEAPTAEEVMKMYLELGPRERRKALAVLRKLEERN
jgi:hypothetical protein